jgi:glycosyltransferase involved in cell wall biosynthesis
MRRGSAAEVSVCIPAWRAAGFIDRTLRCAREQTHDPLRIVVSIDLSDDGTEEICNAHARADRRVEVHTHCERLGWARNVNFLLDHVDTEFAFLYFHDDIIEPTYTERLIGTLRKRPDAASAHCDVGHFGGSDWVNPGRQYEGTAVERVVTFLVAPDRGSLLRSVLRRTVLDDGLRMPTDSFAGVWANEAFLIRLVAAGPALRVPETLYRRWDQRGGGLTDSWLSLGVDEIIDGHRVNAEYALAVIDGMRPPPEERAVLLFALFVNMSGRMRAAERMYDAPTVSPPERLLPVFEGMTAPPALQTLPAPLRTWVEKAYDRLLRETGARALHVGDHAQAVAAFDTLIGRNPTDVDAWLRLADAYRGAGRTSDAEEALRRAQSVRPA